MCTLLLSPIYLDLELGSEQISTLSFRLHEEHSIGLSSIQGAIQ